jgi:excisionase family DNA binding protein
MKRYTTREAAERLDIAPVTVRRHIEQGHLSAEKCGRDYFITDEELARFAAITRRRGPRPKGLPATQ